MSLIAAARVFDGRTTAALCQEPDIRHPEHHEYELYLAVEDIDHSRTKTKSPQTNGIAERFHKTVLEFYRIAKEALCLDRGFAGRPRSMGQKLQRGETASRPLVLRQDADANIP